MTTSDVTVWNEEGTAAVTIEQDGEGKWRFFVDAKTEGSESGVSGDDMTFHDEQTYNAGETKDLFNYLVPVNRVLYLHSHTGSSSKTGAQRSHFSIVNKEGDVTEVEIGGFYADAAHQNLYPKALAIPAGDRLIFRNSNNGGQNNILEITVSMVETDA